MVYPILVYGFPVLRKPTAEIEKNYEGLQQLIDDMFETLAKADGVGLAAPQIGKSINLIVIDATSDEKNESMKNFKMVLINPRIIEESGDDWVYNEGCLSIPEVREDIKRKLKIHIQYYDRNFKLHDEYYDDVKARIILHEYDHLEGKLIIDRISPLRRRLLKAKLTGISKGKIQPKYRIKCPE